jgi:membrane-bound lytic murein transglycosylase B
LPVFFRITGLSLAWLLSLFLYVTPGTADISDAQSPLSFTKLQKRLIHDGFDAAYIHALYHHPRTQFELKGVALFFVHSESRLNYDQFLSEDSLQKAHDYMQKHQEALTTAEKEQGIAPEIITAILLVETRLGTYIGKRSVLNTLSTMAALEDRQIRSELWQSLPESRRYTESKFEKKADQKAAWAYHELKAFLKYAVSEKIDATAVPGSYAGAMGISQFMPSNVLRLGRDGDADGRINLFTHADAIASIANYLKHYGWHPGLSRKNAYTVLLKYNYSKYYVNTLLNIYDRLKG